jgi:hypothetical protein
MEPEVAVIARQWPGKHTPAARDMHTAAEEEEEWEAVFSMWSASRLCNED